MAKYEDYIQEESERHEPLRDDQGRFTKSDSLIEEIEEARVQQETREEEHSAIPERFRNKSPEEIAQSYVELERLSSRQANDLGNLRKQVDQLLELQTALSSDQPQSTEESKPLTMDDLYDNPEEAIRRVVGKALGDQTKRVEGLEESLQKDRAKAAFDAFTQKHPDYQEVGQSPEFVNWVMETPYRQRLGVQADSGDLDAADDLLSLYKDVAAKQDRSQQEADRQRQLRDASLESTDRSGQISRSESFSRSKLMELKIAAKRGDQTAQSWLAANEGAIQQAYAEGRVVD